MSTDRLNIPDDLAEKLAHLGLEAGEQPEKIENEIRKRRAAQNGIALGASALLQREEDEIGNLEHHKGQMTQIVDRARRMLGTSAGNGSDDEQGNPPTDQPPHAEFTPRYQGYVEGRGHRFLLDASASTGSGDLTFAWDAGDGRPPFDVERNSRLDVFYLHEGAYPVTLRVTDSQNRSDHTRQMVQVPPDTDADGTRVMPQPPAHVRGQHDGHSHWLTLFGSIVGVILGTMLVAPLSDGWVPNDNHDVLEAFWYVAMALVFGGAGFVLGWYADHQGRGISDAGEE